MILKKLNTTQSSVNRNIKILALYTKVLDKFYQNTSRFRAEILKTFPNASATSTTC